MDSAAKKYVDALITAQDSLKDKLEEKLEELVEFYVEEGTMLFEQGQYENALQVLSKAATLSENGKRAQKSLKAKIVKECKSNKDIQNNHIKFNENTENNEVL